MMRVSAFTLGCKVNQYDTTAMVELLTGAGYEAVPWGEPADVFLINTCTVTNIADRKSRSLIRRMVRQNPNAIICVCGCLAQDQAQAVAAIDGVDVVIGTQERARIVELVEQAFGGKRAACVRQIEDASAFEPLKVHTAGEKTRGYVKIQEGCNNFCSYCIIPYVRGRSRSREIGSILDEVRGLAQNGVREVVLTGIHISSYGEDTQELLRLLRELQAVDGILRIRLGSLEPQVLEERFVAGLAGLNKVCPHFHVPLQHGNDAILKAMNRRYTAAQYKDYIKNLRDFFDVPAITTDVITGFPGEGEAEFLDMCGFAQEIGYAHMHVFPYSERSGTAAVTMPGTVPLAIRKERARRLIEIGEQMEHSFIEQFAGSEQELLLERQNGAWAEGYTSRYVRVKIPRDQAAGHIGQCVRAMVEKRVDCHATGNMIP